jgi:hypothetical protein
MITDDHKSSKQLASSISISRKRHRAVSSTAEDEFDALTTPASSRKTSICGSETEFDKSPHQTSFVAVNTMNSGYFSSTNSNDSSVLGRFNTSPLPTPSEESGSTLTTSPKTPNITNTTASTGSFWQNMMPYSSIQLPVNDMSNLHHRRTQSTTTSTTLSHPILLQDNDFDLPLSIRRRRTMEDIIISDTCSSSVLTATSMQSFSTSYSMTSAPVSPTTVVSPNHPIIPTLDRIVPPQGPITGGIEITIVGENFHLGLTLMFGNRAATNVCCNSNSIICILPPAEHNGPVVVSFKEHPLIRASPVPPLFNYFESANQNIIDLSNQAIGIRAPSVAATTTATTTTSNGDYFQTHSNNSQQFSPLYTSNTTSTTDSTAAADYAAKSLGETSSNYYNTVYQQNTELQVLNMLSSTSFDSSCLAQTTSGGQNLLHLAAYLNYPALAAFLISRNPTLAQSQDRNGLSPLHFSCHSKADLIIQLLLKSGANIGMTSNIGTPLDLVNSMLTSHEYNDMERQLLDATIQSPGLKVSPVSWLPDLFGKYLF